MESVRPTIASLFLLALLLLVPAASGYHQGTTKAVDSAISETVTLPVNNWTAYTFNLGAGDSIVYTISVTSGTEIDVYFVPEDGLTNYASDSATTFRLYRDLSNRRNFTGSFADASGAISVIIDNVDIVPTGANPTGPVTVAVNLSKNANLFSGALLLIGCGVILLVVAVVIFFVLRRRKAAAPPPPMPYGIPPYPGQPPPPAPPGPPGMAGYPPSPVAPPAARIPCQYCGTLVDPTARTCPSCNAPLG